MRSIALKLFLSMIAVNFVALLLAVWLFNLRVENHFEAFRMEILRVPLLTLAEQVRDYYEDNGSLNGLRERGRNWISLITKDRNLWFRHRPLRSEPMHRPPHVPAIVLLDKQGNPIAGQLQNRNNMYKQEVLANNGELIAYLAVGLEAPSFVNDQLLYEKLSTTLTLWFSVMALVSVLIAAVFSRTVGRTLVRYGQALHRLTLGNYDVPLQVKGNDELAQLANDINTLSNTLAQQKQSQQRWLADIAHEIRTPLSIVSGELEALRDGVRSPNDESIKSLLDEAKRLNRLVEDLRQLALADLNEAKQQSICVLDQLIEKVVERHRPNFEKCGLDCKTSLTQKLTVMVDEDRLMQLLDNLATNSSLYTDVPGHIRVSLEQQDKYAVIVWEDSSPGVSGKDLSQLGERLFRPDNSRSRVTGGSGLGLSIAKSIADAHGWQLSVNASTLGGLCWQLCIPLFPTA